MGSEHARYRALGHETTTQDGKKVDLVWLRGTVPKFELPDDTEVEYIPEGLSGDPETKIVFKDGLPGWIVLQTLSH